MKALSLTRYGAPGSGNVELIDAPERDPLPGQVAVAIHFAPINPSDLLLIAGYYGVRPSLPTILGAEGVGRVVAVGDGVDDARIGEQVIVVPAIGRSTWTERTIIDASAAVAVDGDPRQLSMLGINPLTAWALLHGVAEPGASAWIAQTGATSATAGYVRALAAQAGLRLIDVVRPEAVDAVRASGAQYVVADGPDLANDIKATLEGGSIELLIDSVGGPSTTALAKRMSPGGTIVSYTSRGGQPVSIDIGDLVFRGLTVQGLWLLPWIAQLPPEVIANRYRELAGLVNDGTLFAHVEATYSLGDFGHAFGHAGRPGRTGKILFDVRG